MDGGDLRNKVELVKQKRRCVTQQKEMSYLASGPCIFANCCNMRIQRYNLT